jgi:hypothetical protein
MRRHMGYGRARIAHGSSSTGFVIGMQNAHADDFPSEPSARSLSKVLASVSRVRHIDGLPIAVRTASCNRRHEDDGSLSGERAEDEGSTLEENEREKK